MIKLEYEEHIKEELEEISALLLILKSGLSNETLLCQENWVLHVNVIMKKVDQLKNTI